MKKQILGLIVTLLMSVGIADARTAAKRDITHVIERVKEFICTDKAIEAAEAKLKEKMKSATSFTPDILNLINFLKFCGKDVDIDKLRAIFLLNFSRM
jgi:transposase